MTRFRIVACALGAAMLAGSGVTLAAGKIDFGKKEYTENCANCHGEDGKGNGPFVELLTNKPTDLTVLSKNNGGAFPFGRVYDFIAGTQELPAHGTRDMPIWGQRYKAKAADYYGDVEYSAETAEWFVHSRILALAEYIFRLQEQ